MQNSLPPTVAALASALFKTDLPLTGITTNQTIPTSIEKRKNKKQKLIISPPLHSKGKDEL